MASLAWDTSLAYTGPVSYPAFLHTPAPLMVISVGKSMNFILGQSKEKIAARYRNAKES